MESVIILHRVFFKNFMKRILLFFLLTNLTLGGYSQCKSIKPFSIQSIPLIHDIYQFTFLHYPPENKLDSLICMMHYPMYVLDSSYYRWPEPGVKIRSVIDYFNWTKVIDEIGQQRTAEAFFLLYLPYIFAENQQLRNMHEADDLSPLNAMLSAIPYYGGAKALNTYYLNNKVKAHLPTKQFEAEVLKATQSIRNNYTKNISFCIPLDGEDYSLELMKKEKPQVCDSVILSIIHKYINKKHNLNGSYSLDSILIDVYQLPNIIDAETDQCVPQMASADGVSTTRLGVIYHSSDDFITKQKKYISRVYTITSHPEKGQTISDVTYSLNFIANIRNQCNEND